MVGFADKKRSIVDLLGENTEAYQSNDLVFIQSIKLYKISIKIIERLHSDLDRICLTFFLIVLRIW